MNTNITDFRLQIGILIERKKVSIAKLSRMADLNSATVYRYLQGKSEILTINLEKLFDVLNSIEEPKARKGQKNGDNIFITKGCNE